MTPPEVSPGPVTPDAPTLRIPVLVQLPAERDGPRRDAAVTLPGPPDGGPGPAAASAAVARGRVAGRYLIEDEIGRGGMGVVYRAFDRDLRRHVAMKVMQRDLEPARDLVERFVEEAQATAQLQHPAIVPVYEIGNTADGRLFFAMKLVRGRTLAEIVERRRAGDPDVAAEFTHFRLLEVLSEVCRAVAYANHRGVVHRDLKPQNVMIGRYGEVQVMDWGLAKVLRSSAGPRSAGAAAPAASARLRAGDPGRETAAGAVLGTPAYMAPEQVRGDLAGIGPATDVYALGATLYHVLAGRPPFEGASTEQLLRDVLTADPPRPRSLDPHVPPEVEAICLRAMAKAPERRYASAGDLAADLQAYLEGRPVKAYPVGALGRTWLWCRRRPVVAALAATVAGLLVLLAAGSFLAALELRARSERALAESTRATAAERDATAKLREALLAQARAGRSGERAGRRLDGLDAIGRAAAIRPSLELRNEAIACLAIADLRVARTMTIEPWASTATRPAYFDPEVERIAVPDEQGSLEIRRLRDGAVTARFPGPGHRPWVARWSPDGRFLAMAFGREAIDELRVFDVPGGAVAWRMQAAVQDDALDIDAASATLAMGLEDGRVLLHDLRDGREIARLPDGPPAKWVRFSPDGRRLAVSSRMSGKVRVVPIGGGGGPSLSHPKEVRGIAWHPGGQSLATACADGRVYLWEMPDGKAAGDLQLHADPVIGIALDPTGELLATTSWDGTFCVSDVGTGRPVVRLAGGHLSDPNGPRWSPDGRRLSFSGSPWRVEVIEVERSAERRAVARHADRVRAAAFDPTGRLLATAGADGVRLRDLAADVEVARLPVAGAWSVDFLPDGSGILVASEKRGLELWPVARPGERSALRVGPPATLGGVGPPAGPAQLTPDGRRAAAVVTQARVALIDLTRPEAPPLSFAVAGDSIAHRAAVAPGGEWIAYSSRKGATVCVLDARTGALAAEIDGGDVAAPAFSPDGRRLVVEGRSELRLHETGSFRLVRVVSRLEGSAPSGPPVFARDGRTVAFAVGRRLIRLADVESGAEIATLESPSNQFPLAFSPDGSRLVVAAESYAVQAWDLRRIRARLSELGLDWDAPPYPAEAPAAPPPVEPLAVEVVAGP